MASEKLVLAVDCDDVLVSTAELMIHEYNKRYDTDVQLSAFYDPNDSWGAPSVDEAVKRVDVILRSGVTDNVEPDSSVVEALAMLVEAGHEPHIVTGRQGYMEPVTHRLAATYFPGVFASIEHTDYYGPLEKRRSKADVCRQIGAHVLIDDHIAHGSAVLAAGIQDVIVYGNYPWNQHEQLAPGMSRCASWVEVVEEIERIAARQ